MNNKKRNPSWGKIVTNKCKLLFFFLSKYSSFFPLTFKVTLETEWSTSKSNRLYSLQPKMEKLYTVSKNKAGS